MKGSGTLGTLVESVTRGNRSIVFVCTLRFVKQNGFVTSFGKRLRQETDLMANRGGNGSKRQHRRQTMPPPDMANGGAPGSDPLFLTPAQGKEPFFPGSKACACASAYRISRRADPGSMQPKKNPRIIGTMIRGCPSLSTYRRRPSDPRREAVTSQAGILTPGSSFHRVFPTKVSDLSAVFVPGYSGGPVSDLHGVPNYSSKGT
jgi:hypothetical protein